MAGREGFACCMSTTLRIIIASLALLALGFHYLIDKLLQRVERQYLEAAEEPMVDAAHVFASLLEATLDAEGRLDVMALRGAYARVPERRFTAQIYEVVKSTVDMDLYVVDRSGLCLFDSRGIEEGKSLIGRRDVMLTLAGSYGARSSREVEENDRTSVMFVGAPVRRGEEIIGAVSIIKPQHSMFEFIAQTQRAIRTTGWSIYGVIGLGVVLLSWWLLRPLDKLSRYAQAVARGERVPPPALTGSEAVTLGRSFEAMRDALEDRAYVETYVQSLTHEMKSPVAAIRGAVELAAEPGMDEERRGRFLQNIQAEAGRMQRIIDRLLALSEIESRKTLEKPDILNLATLVQQTCEGLRPAFAARQVRLELEAAPNVMVSGDTMLLEMAVDNLLQNALDFSPSGGLVSIHVQRTGDGLAEVRVLDEGPGIPDYAVERVFERFYSLQHPATGRKSSGLGLCFVREAAQLHHGSASVGNRTDRSGVLATLTVQAC